MNKDSLSGCLFFFIPGLTRNLMDRIIYLKREKAISPFLSPIAGPDAFLPISGCGGKSNRMPYRPSGRGMRFYSFEMMLESQGETDARGGGTEGEFGHGADEGFGNRKAGLVAEAGRFAHVAVADTEEDDAGGAHGKAGEHGDAADLDLCS